MLNPEEFWTTMPLPSIAINDPLFRNIPAEVKDNWSGPPMALTYQRAVRALESYGHYAELTLIGHKLLHNVGQTCKFGMNFDPFTGRMTAKKNRWDYGPMVLSVLEYISRMYGIHTDEEEVYWSGLGRDDHPVEYTQRCGDLNYTIYSHKGIFKGLVNGQSKFCCSNGVRVVTDLQGNAQQVIGDTGRESGEPRKSATRVSFVRAHWFSYAGKTDPKDFDRRLHHTPLALFIDDDHTAIIGVVKSSRRPTTGSNGAPPRLIIGSMQTEEAGKFFDSDIDDVRLYGHVLTDLEIADLANQR